MTSSTKHGVRRSRALGAGTTAVLALALCTLSSPLASAAVTTGARVAGKPLVAMQRDLHPGLRHPAAMRAAPHVTAPAATFVVTSSADSPLASPKSRHCVDAQATHPCSLRAAVQAANNLDKPVVIKLAARTYTLTDTTLGALSVTNAGGTSIVGISAGATKIMGDTLGVLYLGEGAHAQGASLILTSVGVHGGTASAGAGIEVQSDPNLSLVLDKVTISGNHATSGGGVYCEYCSLWATDSSISGNSADYGGAIYNYLGDLYLTNDTLNSDTAVDYEGGAIYQEYGTTHIVGGSYSGDTAGTLSQSGDGGAFYDEYGANYLTGATVSHDSALNDGSGGADYEDYGALTATSVTFTDDRAVGGTQASGGALYLTYSGNYLLHHVTMSHDTTSATLGTSGGGAIFDYGYELGNALVIDQNSLFTDNGSSAVYLEMEYGGVTAAISDTTFKNNTSSLAYAGSAVRVYSYEYGGITLTMLHDKILDNTAVGADSAGGVEAYADYGAATMRFDGDTVSGNVARGSGGSGGIASYSYAYAANPVEIDNSSFAGNRAPDAGLGGAVSVSSGDDYDNPTLVMANDVLTHNSVGSSALGQEGDGGAIATADYAAVTITNCKVADNTANGTAAAGAEGGGIYDGSDLPTTFSGDVVSGNRVTGLNSEGGGIWTSPEYGGGLLTRSTISGNYADDGGGVFVDYYTFDITLSTISKNVAGGGGIGGEGGGVYIYESTVSIINSTIADNFAQNAGSKHGYGGAVYNEDGTGLDLYYSTVSGNAALLGGGLFTVNGSGTLRDSILAGNHSTLTGTAEAECAISGTQYAVMVSTGGNVLARPNCVVALSFGDTVTAKPGLLALAGNGGPTLTMALTATSPALNAAHGDCVATDQRGTPRPKAGTCDAGSYQRVAAKK